MFDIFIVGVKMENYFALLPIEIVYDKILPFTYKPQPSNLLEDLRSYYHTTKRVKAAYKEYWSHETSTTNIVADLDWLSNDIARFLNDDKPIAFGFVKFYKNVFKRLYMNKNRPLDKISFPYLFNSNYSDIKVSIGLMTPSERELLETFLGAIII